MRSLLFFSALAFFVSDASAGGNASVVCGENQVPVLVVNFTSGSDAGTPGLVFLGVLSPDQTNGAVMSENGWIQYQSGLYPYWSRFDNALPPTFTRTLSFPGGSSTAAFVGYSVYLGHGTLSAASKQKVSERRATLTKARPALVAAGAWNAEYQSDDQYIWALVQQDMVDNRKNALILTIPYLECNPDISG